MDTTRQRTGAATPPRQPYDRAATARCLRALTLTTALAGAGAVAAFGLIVAQGGSGASAQVAAVSSSVTSTTTTAAPAATTSTATTNSLQGASGQVSAGSGPGQVTTGGS